jgi:Na+/H+ antiporter NhaD/arsenite permease-like protein
MILATDSLGAQLPLWSVAPFVILLILVAVLELLAQRWWSSVVHKGIVIAVLAVPAAAQLLVGYGSVGGQALGHSAADYVSFIMLLGTLYVISGGIEVKGSLTGTPLANLVMLGAGAVLANLIGTTGASMVLIRPFLRANAKRRHKAHLVVFFILIVANSGGLLTPLGDPPLYLGFLKGVPFTWTLGLWAPWLFVNGVVLLLFNLVDQFVVNREERESRSEALMDELMEHEPLRVVGARNVLFLVAVIAVLVGRGSGFGTGGEPWPFGVQEALLGGLAIASYVTTGRSIHASNLFSLRPIISVAVIFLGIFITMTAPLLILNARSAELGLQQPWQFFWATGGLSSVLDNAPTYLSFTSVAAGQLGLSASDPGYLSALLAAPGGAALLVAISCGAVFMGSLTYIGNGPNLMVKEIAEDHGVRMPHFFAYALGALVVMIPVFIAATYLFFPPS